MNKTEIYEKVQSANIVSTLIESAEFGNRASVYMVEKDQLGQQAIVFDTGMEGIKDNLAMTIYRLLTDLFGDELVITGTNSVFRSGSPTKIEFAYAIPPEIVHDYSKAKDYMENVCPPDYISDCCKNALERLWKVFGNMGAEGAVLSLEDFKGVASTLSMCNDIAQMITEKEE